MKRANDDVGRDQRRAAILTAAEKLLVDGTGELPSVARIAAAAGLAKGTIYLYFATKEEVLAAVLRQLWEPMLTVFEQEIGKPEAPIDDRIRAFAARFASYCDAHAHLMRLDALSKEVLERNMSLSALAEHKGALEQILRATGTRVDAHLGLPPERGFQILARVHALLRGLWQSFGEPPNQLGYTFVSELREATAEYLAGAIERTPETTGK